MIKYREKDNKEGENMESIFFDSQVTYDEHGNPIYDRPNSAEQIRKTFSSLISNGVVSTVHNNMGSRGRFYRTRFKRNDDYGKQRNLLDKRFLRF